MSTDHQDRDARADDLIVPFVDHARSEPREEGQPDDRFDAASVLELNGPERWILTRVRTKGVTGLVLQLSLMAVLASVVLVTVSTLVIWGPDDPYFVPAVIMGVLVPAVVAPPVLVFTVRLAERLDAASHLLWTTARTDPLTGLRNRRAYFEALDQLATSATVAVDLGLVDIDSFKAINDSHGHLAGDNALREVARWLEGLVGQEGLVARIGGDEFAVIAPVGPDLRPTAHRLSDDGLDYTLSVGWHRLEPGDDPHAALHEADVALYARKRDASGTGEALAG